MAEAATPATGANQEPPDDVTRMASFLEQYDKEKTDPQTEPEQSADAEVEQPQGQAPTDELTPDDLPADDAQAQPQPVDEFEIVHNGQQRKLTREETIRFAQQGFDYSQKMHAVGEAERAVTRRLTQVQQLEQLQQAMAPDIAQVKAAEQQLAPWQNVNWVQLHASDPQGYPAYRAQYDQAVHMYQTAMGQFQQKAQAFQQQRQQLAAQTLEQQRGRLLDLIPAWKDPAKYEQGAQEVRAYLIREGVDPNAVEQLSDASSVAIAYKAAQYDKLMRSKSDKSKRLNPLPPVTKPGAKAPSNQAALDRQRDSMQRLRKSGSLEDAAAALYQSMK